MFDELESLSIITVQNIIYQYFSGDEDSSVEDSSVDNVLQKHTELDKLYLQKKAYILYELWTRLNHNKFFSSFNENSIDSNFKLGFNIVCELLKICFNKLFITKEKDSSSSSSSSSSYINLKIKNVFITWFNKTAFKNSKIIKQEQIEYYVAEISYDDYISDKKFKFLSLNRRLNLQRFLLLINLYDNIKDNSSISFDKDLVIDDVARILNKTEFPNCLTESDTLLFENAKEKLDKLPQNSFIDTTELNSTTGYNHQAWSPFKDSWISLVTETSFFHQNDFGHIAILLFVTLIVLSIM
jgi:hypothetical protein